MILGWVVLLAGAIFALCLLLFFQLLIPTAAIGYALAAPVFVISLAVGLLLLFMSRRLRRAGTDVERQTQLQALTALALHRGGAITAADAGHSLGMSVDAADLLLTSLCKAEPETVSLEVDDDGCLFYVFSRAAPARALGAKYRVDAQGKVRVEDPLSAEFEPGRWSARSTGRRGTPEA